jgi:hypothetical protein
VIKVADGRILLAPAALQARLVDRIAYLPDAIEEVKRRAGIDRRPEIIRYARGGRSGANLYSLAGIPAAGGGDGTITLTLRPESFTRARFLYLWSPGL